MDDEKGNLIENEVIEDLIDIVKKYYNTYVMVLRSSEEGNPKKASCGFCWGRADTDKQIDVKHTSECRFKHIGEVLHEMGVIEDEG